MTQKGIIERDLSEYFGQVAADYSNHNYVKQGEIVFNPMDLLSGAVSVSNLNGVVSSAYFVISPFKNQTINTKLYSHYFNLHYKLRVFYPYGKGVGRPEGSGGRWNINRETLMNFPMVYIPFSEQTKIAKYLDQKTKLIDCYIQLKQQQIELLEELKTAVINQAVTKGLNSDVPMKDSGIEWLGEIPEHWEVRYLFQVAKERRVSNQNIQNQNLLSLSYGSVVRRDIKTAEGLLPTSFDTYQVVYEGNIILRLTDLQNDQKSLRVGYVTETGIITSAYLCLKLNHDTVPKYCYYLLHSLDTIKMFYGMGGGVRQSLNYKGISKTRITQPPLAEQQQIVDYLDIQTKKINSLISQIKEKIRTLEEFRTSLISSIVTGQLDVREVPLD